MRAVHVPDDAAALIERYLAEGRYDTAADVISAGLRLLETRDLEDETKLAQLRREAQKGIDDLESGRYIEIDVDDGLDAYLGTVRARGMARLREAGVDAKETEAQ